MLQFAESARILIAGQAPGTRVHASGTPFHRPSGDRLRRWLGIGEDVFYDAARIAILPMGFCFPGLYAKGARSAAAPRMRARTGAPGCMQHLPALRLIVTLGLPRRAAGTSGRRRRHRWPKAWRPGRLTCCDPRRSSCCRTRHGATMRC